MVACVVDQQSWCTQTYHWHWRIADTHLLCTPGLGLKCSSEEATIAHGLKLKPGILKNAAVATMGQGRSMENWRRRLGKELEKEEDSTQDSHNCQ